MEATTLSTNDTLTVNTKPIAVINTGIELAGYKSELPIKIIADFTNIPEEQHEIFLQTFKYFYNTEVNIHHRSFKEEPKTIKEKKKEWRFNRIINILLGKK